MQSYSSKFIWEDQKYKPREQVAAKPKLVTSSPATFASEHAAFTAVQIASQISVEDCWTQKL